MPNIKSAKKRVLVNEKKNSDNRVQLTLVKNAVKKINAAIDTNNIEEAERLLPASTENSASSMTFSPDSMATRTT